LLLNAVLPSAAQAAGQAPDAPAPFLSYNATLQIGTSGLVKWDKNALSGNVSLWIQENYPNSSVARIPLNLNTDDDHMLWEAGTNVELGEYYYELQLISGTGIIYKSNPFAVICATCPLVSSSAAAPTSTTSSVSHLSSFSTTYPTSGPTTSTSPSTASPTPTATPAATKSGVSPGAAAGIGIGGAAAVGIVALLIWLFSRSRRRRNQQNPPPGTYTQQWAPPAPQQPPEMTYSSVPPYKPQTHVRQASHELGPGSPPPPSESSRGHMYSPPRSPPLQQTGTPLGQPHDPRFGQPQPQRQQPNQPWLQSMDGGSPHMSYEGSPRSNQEGGFENPHGSPESQQGLFPRRPVGS